MNETESFVLLGVLLAANYLIFRYAMRYGEPISAFANAHFKMKLDKKTGMFWAKPKHGIAPPCACMQCAWHVVCPMGSSKPGYVLVDCPSFLSTENGGKQDE